MPGAVSKRSRRAAFANDDDDGDGSGGVVVNQASSSLRGDSRKKARLSDDGPSGKARRRQSRDSTNSDDEDNSEADNDGNDHAADNAAPPATQFEMLRDADFEHLNHVDEDDYRATQRIRHSRPEADGRVGENHAANNAILESITCYNFMCHVRLHVELGPLLNFIVGENGSGKSAVLTAITLCLGAKASSTSRGGSLKNFIKEGTDHANLVVKIKNQGVDAWRPELFGKSIIIERWFNKSASGFKLKTETGNQVSTKRADVDEIIDYFCLQVDNPLNVLSQDAARQFLNAATPTAKYKYFLQGTNLEQLSNDYSLLQDLLESSESKLIEFEETLRTLKDASEKAIKLRDSLTKHEEIDQKRRLLQKQLIWAQVAEQEVRLKELEEAIDLANREAQRTEEDIANLAERLAKLDEAVQRAVDSKNQSEEESSTFKEAEEEAHGKFIEAKKVLTETHTQERDIHGQLKKADDQVKDIEKRIRDEQKRLEDYNGGAAVKKQRELAEAETSVVDLEQQLADYRKGQPMLQEQLEAVEKVAKGAGSVVEERQLTVDHAESRFKSASQNRKDPLAGYRPRIRHLLKSIDNDSRWTKKPIGPLGTLIKLTKPQWSSVLEKTLGSQLDGFIVSNKSDQERLNAHMDRCNINCPVFITSAHLARLKEPDESFDTILRVLKFENEIVRTHLVITARIEQTLLVEKRKDAEQIMFDRQPPRLAHACITFHDGKPGHGLRLSNQNGNITTAPITPSHYQKPRIMSDNMDSQIDYFQRALDERKAELREAERVLREEKQKVQRASVAVESRKRDISALENNKIPKARARVLSVQEQAAEFNGIDDKLKDFKERLQEAQERKDHYGRQYGELNVQKSKLNSELSELKRQLEERKLASQDFQTKIAKAEEKVKRSESQRQIVLVEKNNAHTKHDLAKIAVEQAIQDKDQQAGIVEEFTTQATGACPERVFIPEGETHKSLEHKYESLRQQLQRMRNQLGASEEEIHNRARETTEKFRSKKKAYKEQVSFCDNVKQSLADRLDRWRYFQRLISAHARVNFAYLLSERAFRGKLILDHRAKKLEIQVEPDNTRKDAEGRNTKTLSGGEKSFSSICLLLAIWDAIGSPLRCLDEFDVFMDNVNRAISTNMLTTAARRSVGKQFILITPNAIEGRVALDRDVKIIRLTDPRQQRLADP